MPGVQSEGATVRDRANAWDEAGSRHLYKHIRVRIGKAPTRWGDAGEIRGGKWIRPPSAEFRERVKALSRAKDSWVTDMKDLDKGDGVPTDMQKKIWADYITLAEKTF